MSDQIQYILPAPILSLPSVYLIPVTPAPNQVLAWSADGSAIVVRPVTSSMVTDFSSAVGTLVTASISGLSLGSAASHAATDFATPASVSTAIGALNLASASTHPASDFATPANIASAITALSLGTASTHPATDFATPASVSTAIVALALGTAATQNTGTGPNQIPTLDSNGNFVGTWIPRSGTDASMATLVGFAGEITVSTDNGYIRVHDGSTPGGKPHVYSTASDTAEVPNTNGGSVAISVSHGVITVFQQE